MCARRRSNFLSRRRKKVTKERATPLSVTPTLRYGATCGARAGRGPRKLASLKQRAALIRPALRSSARTEGRESNSQKTNSHTGHHCVRPGAWAQMGPSEAKARRDVWVPSPCGCAEERSGQRIRARDCLSHAVASLSETPLDASTAGCPKRSEGTQTVGSPFFWDLFFGEAKKRSSPAGARPGLRPQLRAQSQSKEQSPITPSAAS